MQMWHFVAFTSPSQRNLFYSKCNGKNWNGFIIFFNFIVVLSLLFIYMFISTWFRFA